MTDKDLLAAVISDNANLDIAQEGKQNVKNYCNLNELPGELVYFIKKKIKGVLDYKSQYGESAVYDVKSISEGNTSVSYDIDKVNTETIYGLSDADKKALQPFRRTIK